MAMPLPDPSGEPTGPGLADSLPRILTEMHVSWESATLRIMAEQLAPAIGTARWAAQQQQRLAQTRRDLDATVQQLRAQAGPEIDRQITAAYEQGARRPPSTGRRRGLAEPLRAALDAMWGRLPRRAQRAFRRALLAGTTAPPERQQARVQRELDRIAMAGIAAVRDAGGRLHTAPGWVGMQEDTAVANAAIDGHLDLLAAHGQDLVRVLESVHPCPLCEPWEQRILSVSGTSGTYASVADAREGGLWHPRCRHMIVTWDIDQLERFTFETRHLPGTYEQEQRQRGIERHIRDWKRRELVALDDVAAQQARRKVRQWQRVLREHLAATGLQRSRMRERVDFGHTPSIRHALGRAEQPDE